MSCLKSQRSGLSCSRRTWAGLRRTTEQRCICVSAGIYTTSKELLWKVVCMFVQSVGLQCASKVLLQAIRDLSLGVCSWKNPQFMVEGANCYCAAGETQSCVHVTALLFTLAAVSPAACTSLPCAWSRPSGVGVPGQGHQE